VIAANSAYSIPGAILAAALVRLGRLNESKAMAQTVLAREPSFTIHGTARYSELEPAVFRPFVEAWREAGLPSIPCHRRLRLRQWRADKSDPKGRCRTRYPTHPRRIDQRLYDKTIYRQRNIVERCFNRLKQFRRFEPATIGEPASGLSPCSPHQPSGSQMSIQPS
jgi:hypothetical protein